MTGFVWLADLPDKVNGSRLGTQWLSCWVFGLFYSFFGNRWLRVVLDDTTLQEYFVNAGALQGSILCLRLFLLNINGVIDDAIYNIADGTTVMIILFILSVIGLLICGSSLS